VDNLYSAANGESVDPIKSGFIKRNYISGIVLALFGSGIPIVDNILSIPKNIMGYIIPEWSTYVLSIVLFAIGIILIAGAGRGDRCATCGKVLLRKRIPFSLRDGDKIVHAVRELDAGLIRDLRKLKEGEARIELIMDYCHACRRVGKIAVKKVDKNRTSELVPERVVTGAPVWKFVDVIDKVREFLAREEKKEQQPQPSADKEGVD
jgi:hypothetical protein